MKVVAVKFAAAFQWT